MDPFHQWGKREGVGEIGPERLARHTRGRERPVTSGWRAAGKSAKSNRRTAKMYATRTEGETEKADERLEK